MADPCIADTDCIALSGEGTLASLLQADIILDPDPDQAIECRANGLYAPECVISTDACNGLVKGTDGYNYTHLIDKADAEFEVAEAETFLSTGGGGTPSEGVYQSGSLTLSTATLCSDALLFYTVNFGYAGTTRPTGGGSMGGGTRLELDDEVSTDAGLTYQTYGFSVIDNSLEASFREHTDWQSQDMGVMGFATVPASATQFGLAFRRNARITAPFGGSVSSTVACGPTTMTIVLLAISGI